MPEAHEEVEALLAEVASAVADQTPVDWGAQAARTPVHARALTRLRQIAALEQAHRTLARTPSGRPALFTWGPLEVLSPLGAGSFAEVYTAWDRTLDREVALKLRRADAPASHLDDRRWIDEARRLARVRHPHVLVVHGADVIDGRAGIWTERIAGDTLEALLAMRGPMGAREAAALGVDLCSALAAVHAAGLVHGDVTTRNVMRTSGDASGAGSGRIVLMDFGSAEDPQSPALHTVGTPLFCAPEVLAGAAPSAASDVFGAGVVVFRMLTGGYPVSPGPVERLREQYASGERTALRDARPDLPSEIVSAVERATAVDLARRFASAAQFERALALAAGASSAPSRPRGAARALVGVATFAGVALATWWWRGAGERPTAQRSTAARTTTAAPAPAMPAPAAVQPPTTVALQVDAALSRSVAGSREPIASGDAVAPGDALSLELQVSRAAHVYVLDEDERGEVFALFPLAGRGTRNPLQPGVRHVLPGSERGAPLEWQVTSAGGRETILILVAAEPLMPVEQAIAGLAMPREGATIAYAPVSPEALSRLRAVGGLARGAAAPVPKSGGRLATLARVLSDRADGALWIRLIELENPGP